MYIYSYIYSPFSKTIVLQWFWKLSMSNSQSLESVSGFSIFQFPTYNGTILHRFGKMFIPPAQTFGAHIFCLLLNLTNIEPIFDIFVFHRLIFARKKHDMFQNSPIYLTAENIM